MLKSRCKSSQGRAEIHLASLETFPERDPDLNTDGLCGITGLLSRKIEKNILQGHIMTDQEGKVSNLKKVDLD